jgi:pyruvate/2-oxoglutarate dehydrogenase complex dihydrolipoamide acyltransferase (E2) component
MVLDLSRTLPFVDAWNRAHEDQITVFHLALAAAARVLHARPGLNRFVSGGRIYQRRGVQVSFAVKRAFEDEAPLVTVKMDLPAGEPLHELVHRVCERVREGRRGTRDRVQSELRLAFRLPVVALRGAMRAIKALDRWNLLPAAYMRGDPLFASAFMANLGSVGVNNALHHLYDYGTVSLFVVVGKIEPQLFPGENGTVVARPGVRAGFSFDERINDGYYCVAALQLARQLMEDPARLAEPWPA